MTIWKTTDDLSENEYYHYLRDIVGLKPIEALKKAHDREFFKQSPNKKDSSSNANKK